MSALQIVWRWSGQSASSDIGIVAALVFKQRQGHVRQRAMAEMEGHIIVSRFLRAARGLRELRRCHLLVAAEVVTERGHENGRQIGAGHRGPITKRIQDKFFDVVNGRSEQHRDWLAKV